MIGYFLTFGIGTPSSVASYVLIGLNVPTSTSNANMLLVF